MSRGPVNVKGWKGSGLSLEAYRELVALSETEEQGQPPSSGWPWLAAGAAGLAAWWWWLR